jgi:hypothetical protein
VQGNITLSPSNEAYMALSTSTNTITPKATVVSAQVTTPNSKGNYSKITPISKDNDFQLQRR